MFDWINNHFNTLNRLLLETTVRDPQGKLIHLDDGFKRYIRYITTAQLSNNKLIFIGNGGSAAIASHLANDYNTTHQYHALALNDAAALTCLSNDYGYEQVFAKQLEIHARLGDILIAISSSGESANILNAVIAAKKAHCTVITFSGFNANNSLSQLGDLNFYVSSKEYGFVEVAHLALGHALLDCITQHQSKQTYNQFNFDTATMECIHEESL